MRPMLDIKKFQLLANALDNCSAFWLKKEKQEGEWIFWLMDGCGDPDGDYFETLEDVEDYICNNPEVEQYILRRTA